VHGVPLRPSRGTHLLRGGVDVVAEVHLMLDAMALFALMAPDSMSRWSQPIVSASWFCVPLLAKPARIQQARRSLIEKIQKLKSILLI